MEILLLLHRKKTPEHARKKEKKLNVLTLTLDRFKIVHAFIYFARGK